MGSQNIDVELDSLLRAVDAMSSGVVDEITSLSRDFVSFLQGLDRGAWSTEDVCQAFGTSYVEAIEAYDQTLQGVKKDVVRYRDEMQATYDSYRNADDSALDQMNLRLSALDSTFEGDRMGRIAHGMRPDLDYDYGDSPTAPADTSPGQ